MHMRDHRQASATTRCESLSRHLTPHVATCHSLSPAFFHVRGTFRCAFVGRVVRLLMATSCRQPKRQSRLPKLDPKHDRVSPKQIRSFLPRSSTSTSTSLDNPHSFHPLPTLLHPPTLSLSSAAVYSRVKFYPFTNKSESTCIRASSPSPSASWPIWPPLRDTSMVWSHPLLNTDSTLLTSSKPPTPVPLPMAISSRPRPPPPSPARSPSTAVAQASVTVRSAL